MNVIAIVGILEAVNKLALTIRGIRDQWRRDNPDAPIPDELTDANLIAAFKASIDGASDTWDALIARLRERAANEANG